jgi:hypothetical protein
MPLTIVLGQQQAFGQPDSMYGAEQAIQLGANANKVIANALGAGSAQFANGAGMFMILCSANDKVQYTPDGGVTFRDIIPAGGFGYIFSDGFNFRILNTGVADAGAAITRLVPLNGAI